MGRKAPMRLCTFLIPNKFQKLTESDDAEPLNSQAEKIADPSRAEGPDGRAADNASEVDADRPSALDTARKPLRLERKRPTEDEDQLPPLSSITDAPTIIPKEKRVPLGRFRRQRQEERRKIERRTAEDLARLQDYENLVMLERMRASMKEKVRTRQKQYQRCQPHLARPS